MTWLVRANKSILNLCEIVPFPRASHISPNRIMIISHMQNARTMNVCKMHIFCTLILHVFFISVKKYIFGAAHILHICPVFRILHICKLSLVHMCKLCAKYSEQYAQNVCSIFKGWLQFTINRAGFIKLSNKKSEHISGNNDQDNSVH